MEIELSHKYTPLFDLLRAWEMVDSSGFEELTDERQQYWYNLSLVDTVLVSGGRECFVGNQEVVTSIGSKKIEDVKIGDYVLTYDEVTGEHLFNKVLNTPKYDKVRTIRIKLKNGTTIECTPDHKFFYRGLWVEVKELLYLWYGDLEKHTEI